VIESLPFISEQGIVVENRKRRGMVMFDRAGTPATLIAIRETRGGTLVDDDHALVALADLIGEWVGVAQVVAADGADEETTTARLLVERDGDHVRFTSVVGDAQTTLTGVPGERSIRLSNGHRLVFLPGRMLLGYPERIPESGDRSFTVSVWWWPAPDRVRRMLREYDAAGAWRRSILTDERRGG
jgi:hypothetical protein